MSSFYFLKGVVNIDWNFLLFGFKKGWMSKDDVSNYAVELLSVGAKENELDVVLLASATSLEDVEVVELLEKCAGDDEGGGRVKEKWRLAKLVCLDEDMSLSSEEKLDKLQLIYSEFGYPEDMRGCSIYSQLSGDPLNFMKEVIISLKKKLG